MLHGYKIIAICTTKMHSQQDMSFLTELNERLRYLGYRIFIYSTCSDLYWNSRSEQGEKSVFDLIDFDVLDAVIITYEKIKNRTISRNIARSAMEKGLPVIVLDGHIDGCINMNFDFRAGFEKIVRHVVEDHGLRRLHMMAGMKDNVFSDERIEVFRKVLAEHDIPVDDSMISYGDFWSTPTRAATEALIARGELPEAVVCANDSMAVTMCGVLRDHGISVPDDIIITGFDGIEDVQVSSPTLSTCVCASSVTADMIADIILGQRPMAEGGEDISLVPKLGLAQSCGCGEVEQINVSEHLTRINDNFNRYQSEELHFFEMTSNIFGCKNFEEAAKHLEHPMIYNFTCVLRKECIDETVNPLTIPEDRDTENLYLFFETDCPRPFTPHEFRSSMIFPSMEGHLQFGYPMVFVALNWLDIPLGYVCFHYQNYGVENYCKIYQTSNCIGNALGGLRNLRHQLWLNSRMEELYKLDRLTGLYNRNALVNEFEEREESMRRGTEKITFILADLDRLKHINDTYGHMEGDFAISSVAEALRMAAPEGAILARWGGDELVALFTGDCDETQIKAQMRIYLDGKSAEYSKPYEISASVGVVSVEPSELISLDEITKASDRLMYEEKLAKRRARGQ